MTDPTGARNELKGNRMTTHRLTYGWLLLLIAAAQSRPSAVIVGRDQGSTTFETVPPPSLGLTRNWDAWCHR